MRLVGAESLQLIIQRERNVKTVIRPDEGMSFPVFVLMEDGWNDYSYRTMCDVFVYTGINAQPIPLGYTKIMYRGQKTGNWVFEDRDTGPISPLGSKYCSLAVDPKFYEELNRTVGKRRARVFLKAVRDAAYLPDIWRRFENEDCFQTSLLRSVAAATETRDLVAKFFGERTSRVVNQFEYIIRLPGAASSHQISLDFRAAPPVPRRMILLVGPNGTGKTQVLANLAIALTGVVEAPDSEEARMKIQQASGLVSPIPSFYSVVAISFNAFDDFEIPQIDDPDDAGRKQQTRYTYCGIRDEEGGIKSQRELKKTIEDQIFSMEHEKLRILEKAVGDVINERVAEDLVQFQIFDRYDYLSAGQRIAANILTHLVANLRDQSLVLIDEPETHLHPALITRLLSQISELLRRFGSFAIVATHSPLLVQQTTSKSIRVFSRSENDGAEVGVPDFECFGENISALTNRLFNPGEARRDYAELLKRLMKKHKHDAEKVEAEFPDGLGGNARTYLWSMAKRSVDEIPQD